MIIETVIVGPFGANCYIIGCSESYEAIVIDPGDDADEILKVVREHHLKINAIMITHAHIDHIGAVAKVKAIQGGCVMMHNGDQFLLDNAAYQADMFTLPRPEPFAVDTYPEEGAKVSFGNYTGRILSTPGHSPGGICLYLDGHLFTGDTLFMDSVGRTDLPRGSSEQLLQSIREKLLILPPGTAVYPGHGPATTLGREMAYNPFLQS